MDQAVTISAGKNSLQGVLSLPREAKGIVLFAHGSGSGRLSPRNQYVAKKMQEGSLATLLMDLLTKEEEVLDEVSREFRFDIDLLTSRLIDCTEWLNTQVLLKKLPISYFGASTGAACALKAAAHYKDGVKAVVSRGGRPDLAGQVVSQVRAATLLIVGGRDSGVIELNEQTFAELECEKKLEIVPDATHLFEEPGALEEVARLARNWFTAHV